MSNTDFEYEKPTYRLFICWLLAFFAVLGGAAACFSRFAPEISDSVLVKIILLLTLVLLDALFFIIYRTERVYRLTGITFREAARAGGERRRAFAKAHLRRFVPASVPLAVCCAAGFALHTPAPLDTAVFLALLPAAEFSILRIKL